MSIRSIINIVVPSDMDRIQVYVMFSIVGMGGTLYTNIIQMFPIGTIHVEVNNGSDLVKVNLRAVDPSISFKAVRTSRGKQT